MGFEVAVVGQAGEVEVLRCHGAGVGGADEAVVLTPEEAAHAAHVGGTALARVGSAYLALHAVGSDVEPFQFYEDFLTHGEVAVEAALGDADDEGPGAVVDDHLVVDVALDVGLRVLEGERRRHVE